MNACASVSGGVIYIPKKIAKKAIKGSNDNLTKSISEKSE